MTARKPTLIGVPLTSYESPSSYRSRRANRTPVGTIGPVAMVGGAAGVVWSRRLPRTAKPPRDGNSRTAVVKKYGPGWAVYSAAPKIAVMRPRRIWWR
jgi:hypothetical protein